MIKKLPFFMFCLISTSILGQSLKDTVKLPEVLVSTKRQLTERALYINSIDSIVLVNSVHSDLSDLLLKNSSIYIKSYGAGGLATASFRGTSASHTQVLWNGLNINSPLWGQTDLSLLPIFFTDEVSLYYGSSSLTKTSGGLGGCINLNNIPVWNEGIQANVAQSAGSFGYLLSQLKIGISRNKFISNTRMFLEKANNNFRYFDNATERLDYIHQKNAEYKKEGFLQEFYYKLTNRQFAGIKVMSMWNNRNLPPIMSSIEADRYENQKDYNLNLIGEWKYYGAKSNWSLNSGIIWNNLNYILMSTNAGGTYVNFDSESTSNIFSNRLNFQYNISEKTVSKFSADALFINAKYSDIKELTGFDVQRTDLTLQSSIHHMFSEVFSGYTLVQQKLLNGELMPFIAATGFEYQISKSNDLTFRTNFGRNLHIPNLNDIYFIPGGNLNLKPEVGYQADAGLQWNKEFNKLRYQLEITGFASRIENWILWHPSEYRYWTADNVKKVFSRGVEITTSIKGDAGFFKYQIKGNYGYIRTTDQEKNSPSYGMQLIYIPKHVGNIQLFLDRKTYSAVFSWHNTGSRYTSTVENKIHQMSAYYLMDIGLGKTFRIKQHSMDLNFRLNNVLNNQYQIIRQRAMPGRNFSISLVFKFSSFQ